MKSMLTTGKVALADMMGGDGAILKAMSTNETDTVTAYERGMRHADLDVESRSVFERAHSDEQRHKSWMEAEARAA
jgi:rubrerythrin